MGLRPTATRVKTEPQTGRACPSRDSASPQPIATAGRLWTRRESPSQRGRRSALRYCTRERKNIFEKRHARSRSCSSLCYPYAVSIRVDVVDVLYYWHSAVWFSHPPPAEGVCLPHPRWRCLVSLILVCHRWTGTGTGTGTGVRLDTCGVCQTCIQLSVTLLSHISSFQLSGALCASEHQRARARERESASVLRFVRAYRGV